MRRNIKWVSRFSHFCQKQNDDFQEEESCAYDSLLLVDEVKCICLCQLYKTEYKPDSIKRNIFQANLSANKSLCGNLNSQVFMNDEITDIMMPYNYDAEQ